MFPPEQRRYSIRSVQKARTKSEIGAEICRAFRALPRPAGHTRKFTRPYPIEVAVSCRSPESSVFDLVRPVTALETANFAAIHAGSSAKWVHLREDTLCFVQKRIAFPKRRPGFLETQSAFLKSRLQFLCAGSLFQQDDLLS
jgi:hypothetical protein